MKKTIFACRYLTIFGFGSLLLWQSCQTDEPIIDENLNAGVKFSISLNQSELKSTVDLTEAAVAVITIQTSDGMGTDYTDHHLELFVLGDRLVTNNILLVSGEYQITTFYILNELDEVIFIAPALGSELAQFVDNALPIFFSATENGAVNVTIEVISTEGIDPSDLGILNIGVEEIGIIKILFGANEMGRSNLLCGELSVKGYRSAPSNYFDYSSNHTIDASMNNAIPLKEGMGRYILSFTSCGLKTHTVTFSYEELILHETIPLIFEIPGDSITFEYMGETVTYGTVDFMGYVWMDRNLGASRVPLTMDDPEGFGDLFQYNRIADGHQYRDSDTIRGEVAIGELPGHDMFVLGYSSTWGYVGFGWWPINSPCPCGWHVLYWNLPFGLWRYGISDNESAFNSPVKLPAAGYRDTHGIIQEEGIGGYYWGSTSNAGFIYSIQNGDYGMTHEASQGMSVRCVKRKM